MVKRKAGVIALWKVRGEPYQVTHNINYGLGRGRANLHSFHKHLSGVYGASLERFEIKKIRRKA